MIAVWPQALVGHSPGRAPQPPPLATARHAALTAPGSAHGQSSVAAAATGIADTDGQQRCRYRCASPGNSHAQSNGRCNAGRRARWLARRRPSLCLGRAHVDCSRRRRQRTHPPARPSRRRLSSPRRRRQLWPHLGRPGRRRHGRCRARSTRLSRPRLRGIATGTSLCLAISPARNGHQPRRPDGTLARRSISTRIEYTRPRPDGRAAGHATPAAEWRARTGAEKGRVFQVFGCAIVPRRLGCITTKDT